jgi:putative ATP-dependent endonuclease of OLD family
MAKIRHIKVTNFRALKKFEWNPSSGLNCIIGPGDSGKSTVIDAIDLALGPRQSKVFSDADFHLLDTTEPIQIEVTVGDLADPLKNYEKYDVFLRGYDAANRVTHDEPGNGLEDVLTLRLTIGSDLDPIWSLHSERAEAQGREKSLSWGDRVLLAGTRIGNVADYHLSWRKGAVLNRIGDERPNTTSAIAEAKRAARKAFGDGAHDDLAGVLQVVSEAASTLGVPLDGDLQALLNAHSISMSDGTISVHDGKGLPLSSLGVGSSRLLVAGLLDRAKTGSDLILVDELEHGLEPHRIMRFLDAIGAKDSKEKTQSFVTSHSPVVLQELSAAQLFRICEFNGSHHAMSAHYDGGSQGALRSFPEAFLAKSVLLCEGATEVGFLRGLDQFLVSQGHTSIAARGVTLVDTGGVNKLYHPAPTMLNLQYRVAAFRDDDVPPDMIAEMAFQQNSGVTFKWAAGQKIEAAIFLSADTTLVGEIVEKAVELHGASRVDDHIKSASGNHCHLQSVRAAVAVGTISQQQIGWLIEASTNKSNPWFKRIDRMEILARDAIGPAIGRMHQSFQTTVRNIFAWSVGG